MLHIAVQHLNEQKQEKGFNMTDLTNFNKLSDMNQRKIIENIINSAPLKEQSKLRSELLFNDKDEDYSHAGCSQGECGQC